MFAKYKGDDPNAVRAHQLEALRKRRADSGSTPTASPDDSPDSSEGGDRPRKSKDKNNKRHFTLKGMRTKLREGSNAGSTDHTVTVMFNAPAATPSDGVVRDRRGHIIHEIFTSEVSYCKSLEMCAEDFEKPLRALSGEKRAPLSSSEMNEVFSNLSLLLNVNKQFLAAIEACDKDPKAPGNGVGAVFLTYLPFFKSYTEYGKSYSKGIALLAELRTKRSELRKFLEQTAARLETVLKLDLLDSLLIMPIQRLPRYTLLLQDLLDNTESSDPDRPLLQKAMEMSRDIAQRVNQSAASQAGLFLSLTSPQHSRSL